jgi:hypothetical protein
VASSYECSLDHKLRVLVADGFTVSECANKLGLNEQVTRRKLQELCLQPVRYSTRIPIGLSNHSYRLRTELGCIVTDLLETRTERQVSEITGLNRREISRAKDRPYNHDWKLSQIERTLGCVGRNLDEIGR